MSSKHDGFTEDDKINAGIVDENDNARNVLDDTAPPQTNKKTTQKTTKQKRDASAIGRIVIRKLARLPYRTWAAWMKDPRFDLTAEDQKELTDAYMEIVQGLDVDFSSPKWAFIAVLSVNADLVTARLAYMGIDLPGEEEREVVN